MSKFTVTFEANFWPSTPTIPSIEEQYADLWRFAKVLQSLGIPVNEWHPPADTEANSLLNPSFNEAGVTPAALAMAKADKDNHSDIRSLGAWNGVEGPGGMAFTTNLNEGPFPCNVDFAAHEVAPLKSYANVLTVVQAILDMWSPVMILVGPHAYKKHKVFKDRPPVSWMVYLPLKIEAHHAPEAAALLPILDTDKKQKGTLVVSTLETFDAENKEHVRRANDLEVRLADQDLLPRFADFMRLR